VYVRICDDAMDRKTCKDMLSDVVEVNGQWRILDGCQNGR